MQYRRGIVAPPKLLQPVSVNTLAADPAIQKLRDLFRRDDLVVPEKGWIHSPATKLASVLVPLILRPTGINVLLTQRTAHLNDHAGQVSFPGGHRDDGDKDAAATALREAWEEVGIAPEQVEVIGCMPDFLTITSFRVTPVVGLVTPPLNLKLDDFEVADVFEVPLSVLVDASSWERGVFERDGASREFWAMHWNSYYIWGATAGMLVNFVHLLREHGVVTETAG